MFQYSGTSLIRNRPPPRTAVGLLQRPRRWRFLMSEVPLHIGLLAVSSGSPGAGNVLPRARCCFLVSSRERLVFYCRTTSASTAPGTPRRTCCPYAYVLITVLRVSHSCELFPDGSPGEDTRVAFTRRNAESVFHPNAKAFTKGNTVILVSPLFWFRQMIDSALVGSTDFHSSRPQGHEPEHHAFRRTGSESRRCSRDTCPDSYITKHTNTQR